ncbi:MAG: AsmA-like C-terminal region-containing protein, partial [Chthoniobacterales bacterium]
LYDGVARGAADIALSRDDHRYAANVAVEGINFPKLTDLYFKYQTAHGRLSGSYDFTGAGSDARSMRGAGKLKVTEGNVFAIPVFGPLSGLLSSIIPGAGYSVAHQATAAFTIKEGIIHTDDFKVSGKLFGMVGHGDIRFLDDKIDFDLKVSGGGPGVLLTPVYDLFEYKGEGSISKPNWHPKRF